MGDDVFRDGVFLATKRVGLRTTADSLCFDRVTALAHAFDHVAEHRIATLLVGRAHGAVHIDGQTIIACARVQRFGHVRRRARVLTQILWRREITCHIIGQVDAHVFWRCGGVAAPILEEDASRCQRQRDARGEDHGGWAAG